MGKNKLLVALLIPALPPYSIPTGAEYVTLQIKIRWRKVNICRLSSGKTVFNCIFALFAEAGKRHSKDMHLLENSVINMISLLLHVFDWSRWFAISSSHLFAIPLSVLWVALEKSKQLNLDVRNMFVGSHIEPCWGCSGTVSARPWIIAIHLDQSNYLANQKEGIVNKYDFDCVH
jgi:hypothetical protein